MVEKTPIKCASMAEDIRENAMTSVDSVDYVRGLKGGKSVLIASGKLPHPNTGSGVISNSYLYEGKWYRIALGEIGSYPSSAIVNIANVYNNSSSGSRLLYVSADGYSGNQNVVLLGKGGSINISKARILSKKSTDVRTMLDIYVASNGANLYFISYSCNIGFTFQSPEEVSESIPEGYSVKEFVL